MLAIAYFYIFVYGDLIWAKSLEESLEDKWIRDGWLVATNEATKKPPRCYLEVRNGVCRTYPDDATTLNQLCIS